MGLAIRPRNRSFTYPNYLSADRSTAATLESSVRTVRLWKFRKKIVRKTVRLWNIGTGKTIGKLKGNRPWRFAVSSDGNSVATQSNRGGIRLWSFADQK